MAPSHRSVSYISSFRLRQLFNGSQYPQLIEQGKLKRKVVKSRVLKSSDLRNKSLPPRTKSEIIKYYDTKKDLYVLIHQYLLPDGSLGASGKQDPKAILLDGTMYYWEGPGAKP